MTADDRLIVGVVLGRWQANCYLLIDRAAGTAVVVDPGEDGAAVVGSLLRQLDVRTEAILLTHGHLDHLWSMPHLARSLDVPVLLHPDDRWLFDDPAAAFGAPFEMLATEFGLAWDPPAERLESIRDGQRLRFAGTSLVVRHTPGHTPGHVTYLAEDAAGVPFAVAIDPRRVDDDVRDVDGTAKADILFSGDLVFAGSIGRTDLARGDDEQMRDSLLETLELADDTLMLSGHGPWTTVGHERVANPFLRELAAHRG